MTSITTNSRFLGAPGDAHEIFPAEHEVAFDNKRTRVNRRRRNPLLAVWRWGYRGRRKSARRVTDSHRTHAILESYHPSLLFGVACLCGTLMVSAVQAGQPIVNGSFETGDYEGWGLSQNKFFPFTTGTWGIAFDGEMIVQDQETFDFLDEVFVKQIRVFKKTYEATEGEFVAYQLQNGLMTREMFQEIILCSSASRLSWDMEYKNIFGEFKDGEILLQSQNINVSIRDPSDGSFLAGYTTTQGLDDQEVVGMTNYSFDISDFANRTVLLKVQVVAGRNLFDAAFDDFRVEGCDVEEVILDAVCELKVDKAGEDEDEDETTVASMQNHRVAESFHVETFNADPSLLDLWNALFGVDPETSPDDALTMQGNHVVTWEAGILEMGGVMTVKVKTDKKNPGYKRVKIKKARKKEGTTTFISGSGGVNPNLFAGGWHEVKIKKMQDVTVTFDGETITGFLKELKVKLAKDSTTGAPVVKDFKIDIKGVTTATKVKKGIISSVEITVPETVVTALASTEYEEKIKGAPKLVNGHTEAEFEREGNATTEGVDISSLIDGANDRLKERKGACSVAQ